MSRGIWRCNRFLLVLRTWKSHRPLFWIKAVIIISGIEAKAVVGCYLEKLKIINAGFVHSNENPLKMPEVL